MALVVKNPPANTGDIRDVGLIPGSETSPGGGNGNQLHYSWLENPMDRGAWRATVHRVAKSQTWLKQHSTHPCGRGQGLAPAHQQSCQALLQPSLLSAECENPKVRASCAFLFLIVDKDLWGCHSGVRQLCRYIFTLTVTHTYRSRHMPTKRYVSSCPWNHQHV